MNHETATPSSLSRQPALFYTTPILNGEAVAALSRGRQPNGIYFEPTALAGCLFSVSTKWYLLMVTERKDGARF